MQQLIAQKTCGILCSDSSTFEVLIYYINIFFLSFYCNKCFDIENLISLANFLSFCPSTHVRPNPARNEPANYTKESSKWTVFFREIFAFYEIIALLPLHFLSKFSIFFAKRKPKKIKINQI